MEDDQWEKNHIDRHPATSPDVVPEIDQVLAVSGTTSGDVEHPSSLEKVFVEGSSCTSANDGVLRISSRGCGPELEMRPTAAVQQSQRHMRFVERVMLRKRILPRDSAEEHEQATTMLRTLLSRNFFNIEDAFSVGNCSEGEEGALGLVDKNIGADDDSSDGDGDVSDGFDDEKSPGGGESSPGKEEDCGSVPSEGRHEEHPQDGRMDDHDPASGPRGEDNGGGSSSSEKEYGQNAPVEYRYQQDGGRGLDAVDLPIGHGVSSHAAARLQHSAIVDPARRSSPPKIAPAPLETAAGRGGSKGRTTTTRDPSSSSPIARALNGDKLSAVPGDDFRHRFLAARGLLPDGSSAPSSTRSAGDQQRGPRGMRIDPSML